MIVKVSPKRQIALPSNVLDALGVGPGDELELLEGSIGFILRPKRIKLAKGERLRDKIPPGYPPFAIRKYRDSLENGYGPAIRR